MAVDMSNNQPLRRLDNLTLSLAIAGIFGDAESEVAEPEVMEVADDSSENSGPTGSRSAEDLDPANHDDEDEDKQGNRKKRKNRHTSDQIREMEVLFKESPHPDENQRQRLSEKLGLSCKQIKFWFQNRRTQIKAIHERHESALVKAEMEKLREENKAMKEDMNKACCPKCGSANSTSTSMDTIFTTEQQLRIENSRLKTEVERLRAALGKNIPSGKSPSSSPENGENNRSNLGKSKMIFGLEKSRAMEIAEQATKELVKMADSGEPLWIRSLETGREFLNYKVYMKEIATGAWAKGASEASRESGVVFIDLQRLVQSFMDSNQWKEMFPSIISKVTTMEIVNNGDAATGNGAVQLMFAELQMLTPTMPTRELYFLRSCKQLSPKKWAIVDVSVGDTADSATSRCRKRPSGCILEDASNGHTKVTWVEHWERQKIGVRSIYHAIIDKCFIFGAKHWISTLQLHCEWHIFFTATNVPMKDSTETTTIVGRKKILRMAQRMTAGFCQAMGAASTQQWRKIGSKTGEEVRVASIMNLNDRTQPLGLILSAVSSVWLPVSPRLLFDFLTDEARRTEWDVMSRGGKSETVASFAKGQNRGNVVTIQAIQSEEKNMWILQDSFVNDYESMVVYAQVDVTGMMSVMEGHDPRNVTMLPTGFSILPDGHQSRPLVITSSEEEKGAEGGSLLTVATQILTNPSPTAETLPKSMEYVNDFMSSTLKNIKASLQCGDD